jgi:hypothetical protein
MPDRLGMGAVSAAIADEPNIEDERTIVAATRRLGKARIAILTTDPLIRSPGTDYGYEPRLADFLYGWIT